jgi:hypothetical protein
VPASASAQTIGVGVAGRAGSLGFGGELAVNFTRYFGVRGGIGVMPLSYAGDVEDVRYHIDSASPISNIGVDFYPGFFDVRLGGGMMFIRNPTTFDARYSGQITIGDNTYTDAEGGALTGNLDHGSSAPYVVLGLGRQTNRGLGIFLDLGAAFLDEQRMSYTTTGTLSGDPTFEAELQAEAQAIEDEVNRYVKVYPILSAGIRYGIR